MTPLLRSPAAWALALIIAAGAVVSGPDLSAYAGAAPASVGVGLLISAPVTGAGLHAICTAVAGWGLTTAMATGRRRHGVLGAVAGFALHFAWNADWPQSWAQPAPAVVYAVGLAAPAACWRSALRSCPPRSRAGGPDGPPHPGGGVPLGENPGGEGAHPPAGAR